MYPIYFLPLHPFSIAINLDSRRQQDVRYPMVHAMAPNKMTHTVRYMPQHRRYLLPCTFPRAIVNLTPSPFTLPFSLSLSVCPLTITPVPSLLPLPTHPLHRDPLPAPSRPRKLGRRMQLLHLRAQRLPQRLRPERLHPVREHRPQQSTRGGT